MYVCMYGCMYGRNVRYVRIWMSDRKRVSAIVLWSVYSARSSRSARMYVCMVECMYVSMYVWQVAGSSALSYCMSRFPYLFSDMKIYSSVQEQGDCASMAIAGSEMKSAESNLQQGHTDRQTDAG